MSYSFSFQVRQDEDAREAFITKANEVKAANPDQDTPERQDHFDAIEHALRDLVNSPAFGDGTRTVNVNVNGHAEPDHTKREGWPQDTISLSLSQVQGEASA